jgi:hypothetical protein
MTSLYEMQFRKVGFEVLTAVRKQCVDWYEFTNVSEVRTASTIRAIFVYQEGCSGILMRDYQ